MCIRDSYKVKSRIEVREIKVTMKNGSKKTMLIDEKQVVYWSEKYAKKARTEREEIIKKALDVLSLIHILDLHLHQSHKL